eukprot:CAMPEP_0118874238 /NCGR_PEP_ID=MMETSP1163-20130328/15765_1 /TAXON_ID=124430 /ORGANISM="Phaeomonas parva, Strain CCMP2877" /LENGTH=96 /DNA_ID=CAMNT_0006809611 /DNA_START=86 /DNA_END=372 /DNA_ORIENTATION=+
MPMAMASASSSLMSGRPKKAARGTSSKGRATDECSTSGQAGPSPQTTAAAAAAAGAGAAAAGAAAMAAVCCASSERFPRNLMSGTCPRFGSGTGAA